MRDYEELVKRLRKLADEQFFDFEKPPYLQAADAIEELVSNADKFKWISTAERLPEENGRYLVVLKRWGFVNDFKLNDEEIKILRYHDGWRLPYHIPEWINETLKQEVTHWMPLPEPPEVKK